MATLFNTLGIGYSGLNASQVGINTIGQNISNAETDGYSRKRVIQSAADPLRLSAGNVGNGVEVEDIERVYDDFIFRQYTATYSDKENSDFTTKTLDELSTYFPEIDDVGIKSDLKEYYNLWQQFSDNPSNSSVKIALAEQTQTLTNHIHQTRDQVYDLQQKLNDELKVNVDEVNKLAAQIADLNKEIDKAEAGGGYTANDLRDKRGVLERDIARLIGGKVSVENLSSNIQLDSASNEPSGSYSLLVNGFNIVDGGTYHPLKVDNSKSPDGFYEVYYERQDGVKIPLEEDITEGKIGAILSLRGGKIDETSGMPTDGVIQNTYSQLNAFASTLIESTNNLYAQVGSEQLTSNRVGFSDTEPILNSKESVHSGSFDLIVYDADGNEVNRRTISIDSATTLSGDKGSNSIQGQIEDDTIDDNNDGNANNDIDDIVLYTAPDPTSADAFSISLKDEYKNKGYKIAIKDNLSNDDFSSGTNFAGAFGLNRFFDGSDAKDISLNFDLAQDPTKIQAGSNEKTGDNSVALNMVQHQFEEYDFTINQTTYHETTYSFFDTITTEVGIKASSAASYNDTITAKFNAVELEYQSVSKVDIDEEMTNLIKYQTAYSASAKVITTIDQMLNTLLGIKQ